MTVDEIKERVSNIYIMQGDNEGAHSNEDRLWFEVLLAIGAGAENAQELAQEALKTHTIEFDRWCG